MQIKDAAGLRPAHALAGVPPAAGSSPGAPAGARAHRGRACEDGADFF